MADNQQQRQAAFEQVLKQSQDPEQMLRAFRENGPETLAFSCIGNKGDFSNRLGERYRNPDLINQGKTSLCGPAAFLNCVTRDYPIEYVRYVLGLAATGKGALGKLTVTPGNDCRKASVSGAILPVDWVALASLRDSSNTLWDVESPGSSVAGITTGGSMAAWFKGTGWFQGVSDRTNGVVSASLENLLELTPTDGHFCLFIRSAIVSSDSTSNVGMDKIGQKGKPKTWFGTADHWIVLRDRVTIDGMALPQIKRQGMEEKSLDFRFWHWGEYKSLPSVRARYFDLTVERFLPYYYGYVRASKG